ncbi:MAG TPA: ATP-binding protein [Tepidisphaeraceae bacterium]|jgi:heavy metal sensor kinase|nr:ATP-binding protein [Tepidisphaeraceae bacterium]
MLRSIRWTLQLWHAAILVAALAGFGAATYYQVSRSRFREVDTELTGAAQVLVSKLRPPPRTDGPPPRLVRPLGGGGPGPRRPGEGEQFSVDDDRLPPEENGRPSRGDRPPRGEGPYDPRFADTDRRPPNPGRPRPRDDRPPPPEGERLGWRAAMVRDLALPAGFVEHVTQTEGEQPYFIVWQNDSDLIKASGVAGAKRAPTPVATGAPNTGLGPLSTLRRDGLREVLLPGPATLHVLVGRPVRREQERLRQLLLLLTATGAGVLAVGLMGGWVLSRRAVRPIQAITATAGSISAVNLSGRIDPGKVPSELEALATVLNAAFARLESSFDRQTRFTADASHELRTPLAVIYSHAELALSRERPAAEYRQTIETCLRAAGRMRSLVESLLLLARADSGRLELDARPLDLGNAAEDCVNMLSPLAAEKGITLDASVAPAKVTGDASRIGQVATNLIANAIRYNREGGTVKVVTATDGPHAMLVVSDTGVGISAEDMPHVFERFFRADKARSRAAGGSGLGLAICKSIVEAHGGDISFTSELGKGTTFTVRLPATC